MRWRSRRRSQNVIDSRRSGGVQRAGGIGGGMLLMRLLPRLLASRGGRWLLGIGVLVFIGARALNNDLLPLLTGGGPAMVDSSAPLSQEEEELADFVSVVLGDTETAWHEQFTRLGQTYREPTLKLFSGSVSSACGFAQAAMGPFYCPADQRVYIDLSFYHDLKERHNAPGDFAQAYVIAHEVGHHVQTLLGISAQVHARRQQVSEADANELAVRQELQADCFAGLWGHAANNQQDFLEEGDLAEALNAAAAIGDDRLQKRGQGYVVPESFTHGTSEQRMRWFRRGFESGNLEDCDTFSAKAL